MRTTLTLDDDVAEKARAMAEKTRRPFKQVVNEAMRTGLQKMQTPPKPKQYHTQGHDMGLRAGLSLDNIQELLSQAEGENAR
jgi:hypothetical protein